ncbi:TMhelix containing protein [Vibrio phage 1.052.A._10N.286.46.C3]|nr:TMhelix containing protein [Vibrio phage 1.052.A._10N.286.46.C3]
MAIVNEVITKFSFIGSLKPQEGFNANLKSSLGLLAGVGAAIGAATAGVYMWTNSVTQAIDPMVQLSRETGETISTIQELGYAASQNGSDLDAVMSSMKELTKRAGEFARTGGGTAAESFLQLGINVRGANGQVKKSSELMDDLRVRLRGFDAAQQADILDKLGIDPSMIQLLNQSSDSIDKLRQRARDLGTITKAQADAAASLNDSTTTMRFGMQSLQNQIAVGLAPVVQEMTEGFIDFLIANKDLIRDGIKSLGVAIVELGGFMKRIAPFALAAAAAFGVWKVATFGLGKALALVFSPVTLIVAAIAGIALAIDDLVVAFRGGDSVIRDFLLDWTGFDIRPALQDGVKAVGEFVDKSIVMFTMLKDLVFGMFDGIADTVNGIFDTASGVAGDVGDFFGFGGGNTDAAFNSGVGANDVPIFNQGNNINIYSNDPEAAGRSAAENIDRNYKQARQYYERGGQ